MALPRPSTPFEKKVYAVLMKIPEGKVTTYKIIGQEIQCASMQAIGQALKRNPKAPKVPCHRVIRSDLTLGGYQGATQGPETARKRSLLKKEGVHFDQTGRLLNSNLVFSPS